MQLTEDDKIFWIDSLEECLKQESHGNMETCSLCNDSEYLNPNMIWPCIYCIINYYIKSIGFNPKNYEIPCVKLFNNISRKAKLNITMNSEKGKEIIKEQLNKILEWVKRAPLAE